MGGFKQKAFRLKSPELSEAQLKKQVMDFLQILENQGKLLFLRNNSFTGKIVRWDKSEGWLQTGKEGSPDVIVWLKGIVLSCELKRATGRLGALQEKWQAECERLGHPYFVIRSLDQLIGILKQYGI